MGKRQVRLTVDEAVSKLSGVHLPIEVQVVMRSGVTHFGKLLQIDNSQILIQLPLHKNLQLAASKIEELVIDLQTES